MADESSGGTKEPCNCRWGAKEVCMVLGCVFAGIPGCIAAVFGVLNHGAAETNASKLDEVKADQVQQIQKADERSVKIDNIETASVKVAKELQDTLGPQLFLTWKQLEAISLDEPTKENANKAEEAKAAYLKHVKKGK